MLFAGNMCDQHCDNRIRGVLGGELLEQIRSDPTPSAEWIYCQKKSGMHEFYMTIDRNDYYNMYYRSTKGQLVVK